MIPISPISCVVVASSIRPNPHGPTSIPSTMYATSMDWRVNSASPAMTAAPVKIRKIVKRMVSPCTGPPVRQGTWPGPFAPGTTRDPARPLGDSARPSGSVAARRGPRLEVGERSMDGIRSFPPRIAARRPMPPESVKMRRFEDAQRGGIRRSAAQSVTARQRARASRGVSPRNAAARRRCSRLPVSTAPVPRRADRQSP